MREIIDIPVHILNMVADKAKEYFDNSQERLMLTYSEEAQKIIRKISTHQNVRDPERRELHREIIRRTIGQVTRSENKKPSLVIFCGPPGAGKSMLKANLEKDDEPDNEHLQQAKQIYQQILTSCVFLNFDLFKEMLPEYEAANTAYKARYGDMYAVIRSEASGLAQAITTFAKEQGYNNVLEQLMDTSQAESPSLKELQETYDITVIGVTCDPNICRSRVSKRAKPMQDEEVCRAISGFSRNSAFFYLLNIAQNTFLFNTEGPYKTVLVAKQGEVIFKDKGLLSKFTSNQAFISRDEDDKSESKQK